MVRQFFLTLLTNFRSIESCLFKNLSRNGGGFILVYFFRLYFLYFGYNEGDLYRKTLEIMAQILDRDAQTVLVKITMNEYKKLENMDFFSQKESTEDNWETMVDF